MIELVLVWMESLLVYTTTKFVQYKKIAKEINKYFEGDWFGYSSLIKINGDSITA